MREIADVRVHGTTGEAPRVRFERDEASALKPLDRRPPFRQVRELVRRVQADCAIAVDSNSYRVPWRLIGENVQVVVAEGRVRIQHGGAEVGGACRDHRPPAADSRPGTLPRRCRYARPVCAVEPAVAALPQPALLRPLAEYEQVVGGGWS
jgi:hypothetical protein